MSVEAFADLLERLVFTPGRNAKLALLRRWFATQPDPDLEVRQEVAAESVYVGDAGVDGSWAGIRPGSSPPSGW